MLLYATIIFMVVLPQTLNTKKTLETFLVFELLTAWNLELKLVRTISSSCLDGHRDWKALNLTIACRAQ